MSSNGNGAVKDRQNLEQVVPHSREAEMSTIGSLLIDPDALLEVAGWLLPEHFYMQDCKKVYRAMLDINGAGGAHNDLVVLSDHFENDTAMLSLLLGAVNEVPTSMNIKHYAEIVRERAIRRQIIASGSKGASLALDLSMPIEQVVGEYQTEVFKATSDTSGGKLAQVKAATRAYIDKIENMRLNPRSLSGLSTGIKALDYIIGGFRNSDVIILAGASSMGKTAAALTFVNSLIKQGYRVAFFSLEMSTEQLINRMVSMRVSVEWEDLQNGKLTDEQMGRVYREAAIIADSPLYIDDTPAQTPEQVIAKARKLAMTTGIDCIVVDYLGLMHVPEAKGIPYVEATMASRAMKKMAKMLNVPVLTLAQISRSNNQRGDKRPVMTDLRDSGNVEQDADVIIFPYRDEYYDPDSPRKGITEFIVRKNRTGGKIGTAEAFFKAQYGVFTDLER